MNSGFQEVEHTADKALQVWGKELKDLLAEAARGMYALMGAEPAGGDSSQRSITLPASEPEVVLVAFLNELLFLAEQESRVATGFNFNLENEIPEVDIRCSPVKSLQREIKAVTFSNLHIRESNGRLETLIVFDV